MTASESSSPTVILFLRAPRAGEVKTRLASVLGPGQALSVYRWLAEQTVRAVPDTWPLIVQYCPDEAGSEMSTWLDTLRPIPPRYVPQGAGDLGERLAQAVSSAFAAGASTVLVAGGDSPELDRAYFQAAHHALSTYDAVLGPTHDGGYILLGLKQPCNACFESIAWSTSAVCAQTVERFKRLNWSFVLLPSIDEIDTSSDFVRVFPHGLPE